jgi:hypothetical protein
MHPGCLCLSFALLLPLPLPETAANPSSCHSCQPLLLPPLLPVPAAATSGAGVAAVGHLRAGAHHRRQAAQGVCVGGGGGGCLLGHSTAQHPSEQQWAPVAIEPSMK